MIPCFVYFCFFSWRFVCVARCLQDRFLTHVRLSVVASSCSFIVPLPVEEGSGKAILSTLDLRSKIQLVHSCLSLPFHLQPRTRIHTYAYIRRCLYVYGPICIYIYIYMRVCICAYVYIHIHIDMYTYVYTCLQICIPHMYMYIVCKYAYICLVEYTNIHT